MSQDTEALSHSDQENARLGFLNGAKIPGPAGIFKGNFALTTMELLVFHTDLKCGHSRSQQKRSLLVV